MSQIRSASSTPVSVDSNMSEASRKETPKEALCRQWQTEELLPEYESQLDDSDRVRKYLLGLRGEGSFLLEIKYV
jgi:hypothetical protein